MDIEEIMEMICDRCHYPWITTEDELEDYCAECEIEREIKRLTDTPRVTIDKTRGQE